VPTNLMAGSKSGENSDRIIIGMTSLDGQRLLSAHWDGTVQVWKVNYGTKKGQKKANEQFFECLEICAIIYSVFANFCAKISIKSFKGRDLMVLTFIPKRLANSKSAQWSPSLYFGSGS